MGSSVSACLVRSSECYHGRSAVTWMKTCSRARCSRNVRVLSKLSSLIVRNVLAALDVQSALTTQKWLESVVSHGSFDLDAAWRSRVWNPEYCLWSLSTNSRSNQRCMLQFSLTWNTSKNKAYDQVCKCSERLDYRSEDGGFRLSESCVTISNPDSLSSRGTEVNSGIRSWKSIYLNELDAR
jgi:hypothetical protein